MTKINKMSSLLLTLLVSSFLPGRVVAEGWVPALESVAGSLTAGTIVTGVQAALMRGGVGLYSKAMIELPSRMGTAALGGAGVGALVSLAVSAIRGGGIQNIRQEDVVGAMGGAFLSYVAAAALTAAMPPAGLSLFLATAGAGLAGDMLFRHLFRSSPATASDTSRGAPEAQRVGILGLSSAG